MKRYIDADLLKEKLGAFIDDADQNYTAYKCGYDDCLTAVQDTISDIPAADVAEVRHGKWMGEALECSECGKLISCIYDADGYLADGIEKDFKYCPYCGAKMDKEIANG